MYWQKKFTQPEVPDEREQIILAIREEHKDYGYRRLWAQLRNLGHKINRKAVQRIVQKLKLQVRSFTHRSRRYSSYKGTIGIVADNLLSRRFKTSIPHQKITTDTSEFKYWLQGDDGKSIVHKLYLDPYMDLFNNEIVSFHIGKTPSAVGIQTALEEAIRVTSDCPYRRTFHSDQGWAYQMKSYTKRLKEERIFQSMSRKGNCLDNCSDPQKLDLKAWESDFLRFFLCGEMFATILSRTEPTKRLFDTMLVIVDDIFLNRRLEFLVTMVDAPIVNLLL